MNVHVTNVPDGLFVCNAALIYLFISALIEGLFGQVQHVGQDWNSCHWIKVGGYREADERREMEGLSFERLPRHVHLS